MKKLALALLASTCFSPALAQRQPANLSLDPTATPEILQVLDSAGGWAPVGMVNPGNHMFAPNEPVDPHAWGAKGDVTRLIKVVTATAGNASVRITGAAFVAGDVNKLITFTQVIGDGATPTGPSYQGVISSVVAADTVNVSPSPSFNSTTTQYVAYGSDDTAAINAAEVYAKSESAYAGDNMTVSGRGAAYGVTGPILVQVGTMLYNADLSSLSSIGFTALDGIVKVSGASTNVNLVVLDSEFLPVNGYLETPNGTTLLSNARVQHWFGSISSQSTTATAAINSWKLTVTSTAGLQNFMVSRNNPGIPNRAMIVNVNGTTVTINKPTTAALSSQVVTFYQDANGVVAHNLNAPGVTPSAGMHGFNDNVIQFDGADSIHTQDTDHYGCGLLQQGTQTDFIRTIIDVGVVPICLDATSNGINFDQVHVFPGYTAAEINPPAMVVVSGANNTSMQTMISGGVYEVFLQQPPGTYYFSMTGGLNTNSVNASPNDIIQVYTDQLNASVVGFAFGLPAALKGPSSNNLVSFAGFKSDGTAGVCGTDYGYVEITCARATKLAATKSPLVSFNPGLTTVGAEFLGGTLSDYVVPSVTHNTATTLDPTAECPSNWLIQNGSNPITQTLSAAAPAACRASFWVNGTGVVTLTAAAGAFLNGVAAGSATVTRYVFMDCIVARNPGGAAADWSCK